MQNLENEFSMLELGQVCISCQQIYRQRKATASHRCWYWSRILWAMRASSSRSGSVCFLFCHSCINWWFCGRYRPFWYNLFFCFINVDAWCSEMLATCWNDAQTWRFNLLHTNFRKAAKSLHGIYETIIEIHNDNRFWISHLFWHFWEMPSWCRSGNHWQRVVARQRCTWVSVGHRSTR